MQLYDLREQLEAKNTALKRYAEREKSWAAEKEEIEFERNASNRDQKAAHEEQEEKSKRFAKLKATAGPVHALLSFHAHTQCRRGAVALFFLWRQCEP